METLDESLSHALRQHQDVAVRLAEVPGYGVNSAQQIIAEVGPAAATFPFPEELSSWMGAAQDEKNQLELRKVIAARKATVPCGACSTKWRKQR